VGLHTFEIKIPQVARADVLSLTVSSYIDMGGFRAARVVNSRSAACRSRYIRAVTCWHSCSHGIPDWTLKNASASQNWAEAPLER
jgi:hypothetical protein